MATENSRTQYVARQLRHDSRSNRDKLSRLLFSIIVLTVPPIVGAIIGPAMQSDDGTILGIGLGLLIAAIEVPFALYFGHGLTGQTFQNAFTGDTVNFGAGLHPKFFWDLSISDENRPDDRKSLQTFEIITIEHTEEYDTLSGPMKVVFGFQFMIDLGLLDVYIGVDNSSIDKGFTGIISGFISSEMARMTATEARNAVEYIGLKARRAFVEIAPEEIPTDDDALTALQEKFGPITRVRANGLGVREREAEYGVKLLLVYVADIDYPDSVKKVLAAETENLGLLRIVAQNMGINPSTVNTDTAEGIEVIQQMIKKPGFDDLMRNARVISQNSTEHVSNVTGNVGTALAAMGARMLGDGGHTDRKPQRGRKHDAQ